MTDWVPKSSAPEYFSLADAFLALITGDPTWGWLVDWMTLIPNTGQSTAEFCAQGPIFTEPLVVTDFFPTANPLDPRQAIHTAALAVRIASAARDRVFAAYCQLPNTGPGGATDWSDPICATFNNPGPAQGSFGAWQVRPPAATQIKISLTAPMVGAGSLSINEADAGPSNGTVISTYGPPQTIGESVFSLRSGSVFWNAYYNGTTSGAFCVRFNYPAHPQPATHTPEPQPAPPGVSSPLRTVDPSLSGIAAELERHEFKLDTAWALLQSIAAATLDLAGPTDDPVPLAIGTEYPLGDALGIVVTCSNVPDPLDVGFGTPQQVARLGRLNFGTPTGWYASTYLTHTPMVIRPLPLGVTRVTLTGMLPTVTATIAYMRPNK